MFGAPKQSNTIENGHTQTQTQSQSQTQSQPQPQIQPRTQVRAEDNHPQSSSPFGYKPLVFGQSSTRQIPPENEVKNSNQQSKSPFSFGTPPPAAVQKSQTVSVPQQTVPTVEKKPIVNTAQVPVSDQAYKMAEIERKASKISLGEDQPRRVAQPSVARQSTIAQAQNGHVQNGHVQNGQAQNGQSQNGQVQNGQVQNGQIQNPQKQTTTVPAPATQQTLFQNSFTGETKKVPENSHSSPGTGTLVPNKTTSTNLSDVAKTRTEIPNASNNTTPSTSSEKVSLNSLEKTPSSSTSTVTTTLSKRLSETQLTNLDAKDSEPKPKNSFGIPSNNKLELAIQSPTIPKTSKVVNLATLSTMLSFEQAREYFPWIGALHEEGLPLHPSLPYLSVVFNERGYWDKEHVLLLASNDDLSAQMNWEIRVALFMNKHSSKKYELSECLTSLPRDEAMMIIALQTACGTHEIVLAPSPDSNLVGVSIKETIVKVQEFVAREKEIIKTKVEESVPRCDQISALLELAGVPKSKCWAVLNSSDKELLTDLAKARLLLWQLDNLSVFVSPYTGLIHAKTSRWEPSSEENYKFHPLVEYAPLLQDFIMQTLDIGFSMNRQYENLQKFFYCLNLELEINGEPRTLELNSLVKPEVYIPFELFFTHDQRAHVLSYMRSITNYKKMFHFVAAPAPINHNKTYYSIEGIIAHETLWYHKKTFQAEPMTLSVSKFSHYISLSKLNDNLSSTASNLIGPSTKVNGGK